MRKGQAYLTFMNSEAEPTDTVDLLEKLHQVVDRMLERFGLASERYFPQNALATSQIKTRRSPFDITRPNQHETKAEFQHEYKAVKDGIEFCGKLFGCLVAHGDEDERKSALVGLGGILTGKIKDRAPIGDLNQSHTLVQKIMADVGGFSSTMVAVLTLRTALSDRLQELENQRDKFWNVPYRAPDYYARAIALRLAKLYAKKPTNCQRMAPQRFR
ncbi:hypothetical protein [Roseovarius rhodophyticola]|uniref:Uncharacterized protein n=1 Tax=Roseovarius rhodophyticola TaxID=3080827 RepID=A0ABZ2TI56_9RHOB